MLMRSSESFHSMSRSRPARRSISPHQRRYELNLVVQSRAFNPVLKVIPDERFYGYGAASRFSSAKILFPLLFVDGACLLFIGVRQISYYVRLVGDHGPEKGCSNEPRGKTFALGRIQCLFKVPGYLHQVDISGYEPHFLVSASKMVWFMGRILPWRKLDGKPVRLLAVHLLFLGSTLSYGL